MNKQRPLYKLLDDKGRVLIPKELREAADMRCGDIIKLGIQKGIVTAQKVDIIEVGDQSPEAVEAYVFAAVKTMGKDTQLSLASRLLALMEQEKQDKEDCR